jgi:hypothetical protein
VDVLADPDVRQGIKDYANWPTIPQLYVNGEFVGGSDIMTEMYQAGELQKQLESLKNGLTAQICQHTLDHASGLAEIGCAEQVVVVEDVVEVV